MIINNTTFLPINIVECILYPIDCEQLPYFSCFVWSLFRLFTMNIYVQMHISICLLSQQTQATDVLTQNPELTQLGDDSQLSQQTLSSPPPESPIRAQPWGKLMPCSRDGVIVPLLPRQPTLASSSSAYPPSPSPVTLWHGQSPYLQMNRLQPGDHFNEYTIGRSTKCDVQAVPPTNDFGTTKNDKDCKKTLAIQNWVYGMISNQHCQLYCTLDPAVCSDTDSDAAKRSAMHIYIQDFSGNGTMINQSVLLRYGESRRLHSGDEICLVNHHTIKKKIRSLTERQCITQRHSYVFVNTCTPIQTHLPATTASTSIQSQNLMEVSTEFWMHNPMTMKEESCTVAVHRKAAVNARATRSSTRSMSLLQHLPTPSTKSPIQETMTSNNNNNQNIDPNKGMPAIENSKLYPCQSSQPIVMQQHPHQRRISPRRMSVRRIQQDYDIRNVLGQGTVGEVRRAIHRTTGHERAVKIIAASRHKAQQQADVVQVEAKMLQELDHPYIVQLFDVYVAPPTALYLVMELVPGGDLFDRIVQKGHYRECEARQLTRRLFNAVYYLHNVKNVVHRDLKPENILLQSTTSDIDIKLTDFGLAKLDCGEGLKTFCGTPAYFAPEVWKRRNTITGHGRYGKPADLWSLGVILYVLLTGTPPFDDMDTLVGGGGGGGSINNNRNGLDFDQCISESARDLVRKLLQRDPRQRWTIAQACEHPWILQEDGDTHQHPLQDPQWSCETVLPNEQKTTRIHEKASNASSNQSLPTENTNTNCCDPKIFNEMVKVKPETVHHNKLESSMLKVMNQNASLKFADSPITREPNAMNQSKDVVIHTSDTLAVDQSQNIPPIQPILSIPKPKQSNAKRVSATDYSFQREMQSVARQSLDTNTVLHPTALILPQHKLDQNDIKTASLSPIPLVATSSPTTDRNSLELSDDEILSRFSEENNTKDSIASSIGTTDEMERNLVESEANGSLTDLLTSNGTQKTTMTAGSGKIGFNTIANIQNKRTNTTASRSTTTTTGTRKKRIRISSPGSGTQTTLNTWFKKSLQK